MKPVIITVKGGIVTDVNSTSPLFVVVKDWDCPPDMPLHNGFDSESLPARQKRRVEVILANQ